jgi:hypothetical protein
MSDGIAEPFAVINKASQKMPLTAVAITNFAHNVLIFLLSTLADYLCQDVL